MPKSFIKLKKYNIGYYLWSITNKEMYIHNIDIYHKFQGKGLFENLINDIKKVSVENNCESIRLMPYPQNNLCYFNSVEKLKLLYSKYGFIECKDKNFMRFIIT